MSKRRQSSYLVVTEQLHESTYYGASVPDEPSGDGVGKISWKLPNWSGNGQSAIINAEMEPLGAFILDLGKNTWTDTLPTPDETYVLYGWWEYAYPPLTGMPLDGLSNIRYGTNWGSTHQTSESDPVWLGHTHLKSFVCFENDTVQVVIHTPTSFWNGSSWDWGDSHYKK